MKVCNTCHVEKPLTDFYKSTRDGSQGHCKECHRARQRAYQQNAPAKQAARQRKSRYGLSAEAYTAMVLEQDGAIGLLQDNPHLLARAATYLKEA